jgi:nucleotide-binding universal stress UspA family protein
MTSVPIGRILCPIDFSDASTHAAAHAIALARAYKASITALHVHSRLLMTVPDLRQLEGLSPEHEVQRLMSETAACFADAGRVPVDVLVEEGQPARHILNCASTLPADLIVMGTHGTSGFEHLVLGSVTERVLRKARCPVLTVPPRAQAKSELPFRRLLCAVDFSDSSLAAAALARSIAGESKADLMFLHVIEWPWDEPPSPVLSELPAAQASALGEYRRYLEVSALNRLEGLAPASPIGGAGTVGRVVHGKAHVEILGAAAADRADLIVMGVQGRNAADMMLFGSTTNQVVRRATCPVLTLRR